ncbi:MAG TPA: transporter associated domain-containing protein, partial [Verrucomicrobiota bacterium]|nr:transporter associated domain-containing protein [Verrucomicrobiota bacterium]
AYLGDIAGVETMGGLLLALAGVVPPAGYSVQFGSLKLTATIVDDRRVRELLVEVVPKGGDKAR